MILDEAQKLMLSYGYQRVTMTDIARACRISRTTLYKSYPNKESIIIGLINRALQENIEATEELLVSKETFASKLESFFDIWVIKPAASVIELETGRDILMNVATYAPEAVNNHYKTFEDMLARLIRDEMKEQEDVSPEDLARIFTLASKSMKASVEKLEELKRLIAGLIKLVVIAVG
ncbi:TetR/AcrR family transcriptional regulator [Vibrio vulnificus]|uniref:TetR/AcrR family transcriptional regulator n=1 Tax=Vibrio TaxID=662 RepID=UPI0022AF81AD|nr:TetR/AcrR family transcriptional regulator [Vibrio sinaloensis]MCZ4293177.1 TetR/AcrR family transcriptional regulator [Vibrio sinaloensis]